VADETSQNEVTDEEIVLRAKRIECANSGHTFDVLVVEQSLDPQMIVCSNCGASWNVSERTDSPQPEQPWDHA
jgi:transcription elongation factor Elf1